MCKQKSQATTKVERLIESVEKLTAAIEKMIAANGK